MAADATRRVDCVVVNRWGKISPVRLQTSSSALRGRRGSSITSKWPRSTAVQRTRSGCSCYRLHQRPIAGPSTIWIAAAGLSIIGLLLLPAVAIIAAAPKYGIRALRLVAILLFGLAILSPFDLAIPRRAVGPNVCRMDHCCAVAAAALDRRIPEADAQRAVARVWACLTAIWGTVCGWQPVRCLGPGVHSARHRRRVRYPRVGWVGHLRLRQRS